VSRNGTTSYLNNLYFMAEQKVSMQQLKMVSVPDRPAVNYDTASYRKQSRAFNTGRFFRQLLIMALIALLTLGCYWAISRYCLQTIEVVGESMIPTLQQNGHYILNRWAFHNHTPQRGDIIVIRDPEDNGFSVKRVIALAGESVHFVNGKVYVNGEQLKEPYLLPHTYTFTYAQAHEQLITCGQDQYFVLGDNRPDSIDSRAYGPVPRENILGQVVLNK
jgi:signal peptidase I